MKKIPFLERGKLYRVTKVSECTDDFFYDDPENIGDEPGNYDLEPCNEIKKGSVIMFIGPRPLVGYELIEAKDWGIYEVNVFLSPSGRKIVGDIGLDRNPERYLVRAG